MTQCDQNFDLKVNINQHDLLSRDRTSVGHGDNGLDAITSNQRINTTLCKNKNKHVFKKFKKKQNKL